MLYQERNIVNNIKQFSFDYHSRVLVLMQVPKKKGASKQKFLKIYDLDSNRILWNSTVTNKELLGRIKSGLFTLVDGHMYYNNNVIKIRYDLLLQKNMTDLAEFEVFDFYENILSLDAEERVKTMFPICSLASHRFIYMTQNQRNLLPNKIKILPFLHERKVYLNKIESPDVFYTTIRRTDPELG